MPLRVLLDTSVVRAGFVSDAGASRRLLLSAMAGRLAIFASTALMLEYEAVLLRPGNLQAAGLSVQDAVRFLNSLCSVCYPVPIRVTWRPQSPDNDDGVVLDAAVNGSVDIIATFNLRHLHAPAAHFGIVAEPPAATLRRIG